MDWAAGRADDEEEEEARLLEVMQLVWDRPGGRRDKKRPLDTGGEEFSKNRKARKSSPRSGQRHIEVSTLLPPPPIGRLVGCLWDTPQEIFAGHTVWTKLPPAMHQIVTST